MIIRGYNSYREAKIPWTSKIPSHWETSRLRWISRRYSGGTPDKTNLSFWENGTIPWLSSGTVNDRLITEPTAYITEEAFRSSSAKWIPKGALVMALAGQGKTKGMVAQLGFVATSNQSMAAILPKDGVDARYLFWWLHCNYDNIRNLAGGDLRDGLNLDHLGDIQCPIPPLEEQLGIVNILDRETTKIDALMAEQRTLIEMLKEKRASLIAHYTTKGTKENVSCRDSDIEWIGEIPTTWSVERGRFLFSKLELNPRPDDGVVTAFRDGQVTLRSNRREDGYTMAILEGGYQHVRKGDLVINGMDAFAGAIGVSDSEGKCTPEYVVMTPINKEYSTYYFANLLRLMALRNFVFVICPSVRERAPRFRFETFKDVLLPVPTIDEQFEIVGRIEKETASINHLLAEAERFIAILQEHRLAFITAVVTGEIDVRSTAKEST